MVNSRETRMNWKDGRFDTTQLRGGTGLVGRVNLDSINIFVSHMGRTYSHFPKSASGKLGKNAQLLI